MINSIDSININKNTHINASAVSDSSVLSAFKQMQNAMQSISQLVYQSLSLLTGANDNGLSKEGLNNLKTLLENENMTQKNAYVLVSTVLNKFGNLSSDGDYITQSDFVGAIKFSVAQTLSKSPALKQLLNEGNLNISSELAEMYGMETAQTIAIIQFIDNLSEDTVSEVVNCIDKSKTKSTIKPDSYYGEDKIQDYKTVTSAQLKGAISIYI